MKSLHTKRIDKDALQLLEKIYKRNGNNLSHIIKSLTYFDDAENFSEKVEIIENTWNNVKIFFKTEIKKIIPDIL